MMTKTLFCLFAFVAGASAFTAPKTPVMQSRVLPRAAPVMAVKPDFAKIGAVAASLAAAPAVTVATEGTNELLGIDDNRIWFFIPVLLTIRFLYNQWAEGQDDEDFFDALPPPPKK